MLRKKLRCQTSHHGLMVLEIISNQSDTVWKHSSFIGAQKFSRFPLIGSFLPLLAQKLSTFDLELRNTVCTNQFITVIIITLLRNNNTTLLYNAIHMLEGCKGNSGHIAQRLGSKSARNRTRDL